jgi:hypothetical protein
LLGIVQGDVNRLLLGVGDEDGLAGGHGVGLVVCSRRFQNE